MGISSTSFKDGHEKVGGWPKGRQAEIMAENKKKFLLALEKSMGIVTSAAKICGLSTDAHYAYMRDDPEYRKSVELVREIKLDYAESKLLENVGAGKEASIIFLLKTLGKKRGYIEQPGYELPPDESEFKMPTIEIVDTEYEEIKPKRIENE